MSNKIMNMLLALFFTSIGRIVALSHGHNHNPPLITSDNPGKEECIIKGDLMKLLIDVHTAASDQLSEIASGQILNFK
jgi:hypothetical protein